MASKALCGNGRGEKLNLSPNCAKLNSLWPLPHHHRPFFHLSSLSHWDISRCPLRLHSYHIFPFFLLVLPLAKNFRHERNRTSRKYPLPRYATTSGASFNAIA